MHQDKFLDRLAETHDMGDALVFADWLEENWQIGDIGTGLKHPAELVREAKHWLEVMMLFGRALCINQPYAHHYVTNYWRVPIEIWKDWPLMRIYAGTAPSAFTFQTRSLTRWYLYSPDLAKVDADVEMTNGEPEPPYTVFIRQGEFTMNRYAFLRMMCITS